MRAMVAVALLAAYALPATAQAPDTALARVKESGTLTIGFRESAAVWPGRWSRR